jgi:hypothetical protein
LSVKLLNRIAQLFRNRLSAVHVKSMPNFLLVVKG